MLRSAFLFCLVITWVSGAPGPEPDVNVKIDININGFGEDSSGSGVEDGNSRPYCENCGKGGDSKNRIVGGTPAGSAKTWPWQAFIKFSDDSNEYSCGGSIIKKDTIISAAHCFEGLKITKLEVYLGLYDTSDTADALRIDYSGEVAVNNALILHKDYNNITFDNDIALIKLKNDLSFNDTIQPVCLAEDGDIMINGSVVVTGWGATSSGGASSDILLQVTLDNLDTVKCRELYQNTQFPITANQICTQKPNKDACQGDSGGPLVAQLTDDRWVQIGVVSFGIGCADPLFPGVYTKLPNYHQWINDNSGSSKCSKLSKKTKYY